MMMRLTTVPTIILFPKCLILLSSIKTVKFLNGWSRYAYHSKDTFDRFIDLFSDSIQEVTGPLNKTHASHPATVNAENYWDYKQHVIRKDNYFGKWDTQISFEISRLRIW